MPEHAEQKPLPPLKFEHLGRGEYVVEVIMGIGKFLGLGLLWALEAVRNTCFRVLDRWNVKSRRKPASAFPPGNPRRKTAA